MKNNLFLFNSLVIFISLALSLSMSSCSKKSDFLTSKVVPAAQGYVKVSTDKYNNYVIKVKVSNLSPSSRLTPPKLGYVVWLLAEDNSSRNLGQLTTSESFMAKDLDASFKTVSSARPAKILITAENDVAVQYPTIADVILTTDYLDIKK